MGKKENINKEINELKKAIRYHDYRYYGLSDPAIADREYDALLERLKILEKEHPELITPDSPTQRVFGIPQAGLTTVRHKVRMLSLDNTYSEEEVFVWEKKMKRMLDERTLFDYIAELKVDGVSCSLLYERGHFVCGATRGDGQIGEDVTENIKTIRSIPLVLLGSNIPQSLEVRGEIYMHQDDFEYINKKKIKNNEAPFANPRNATSGSLKLLDARLVGERKLRCFVHSFGSVRGTTFSSQKDFLRAIEQWGLPTNPNSRYCKNLKDVLSYYNYWSRARATLGYEVDGVVIKVNRFSVQKKLGATLKSPRWAVAYKFPAHQATTTVNNIVPCVGRTGIITPVATLVPVECGGVTISHATLHNYDEVSRLDVRIHDTVLIERAGDVIPKVIKVITTKRKRKARKITVPKKCPACKGAIDKEKEEEVCWYCTNPDCPARLSGTLLHFASRGAMDIKGMGESVVQALVDTGMVKRLCDIYSLTENDLLTLPLFKKKKAANLYAAIEESKKKPLSCFLYGLGIRHIGEKGARILAKEFTSIDAFFTLTFRDYTNLSEVGPTMAHSLCRFFAQAKTKKMIAEFKKHGLLLREEVYSVKASSITDKRFVFTGELNALTREEAKTKVEALGAKTSSSVSAQTDFVVSGNNPGSKLDKAKKLGVTILTEEQFRGLIEE